MEPAALLAQPTTLTAPAADPEVRHRSVDLCARPAAGPALAGRHLLALAGRPGRVVLLEVRAERRTHREAQETTRRHRLLRALAAVLAAELRLPTLNRTEGQAAP